MPRRSRDRVADTFKEIDRAGIHRNRTHRERDEAPHNYQRSKPHPICTARIARA